MSKYKPVSGDKFRYDGHWYKLKGGNNDFWLADSTTKSELTVKIDRIRWLNALELFEDYIAADEDDNIFDEELFTL